MVNEQKKSCQLRFAFVQKKIFVLLSSKTAKARTSLDARLPRKNGKRTASLTRKKQTKDQRQHFLATFETFYLLFLTLVSWGHLAPSLIFYWDCCFLTKTSLAVDVSKVWMNLPHLWHPARKVGRLLKLFQVCLKGPIS